jgi:predicted TIM-barrel fold metal-dependent hydrolase
MLDGIKIFDAHMHIIGRFKKRDESFIEFLDRFNIDKAIITSLNQSANMKTLTSFSKTEDNKNGADLKLLNQFTAEKQLDHEEVKKLTQKHPDRLFGFFWFNPRIATQDNDSYKILEEYIKKYNFKGVKTHAYVDLLKLNDYFELAEFLIEYDLPLYFHSSQAVFFQKPIRAKDLYRLVNKYPELKLIIGHAAYSMEYSVNCMRYFTKCPNVFFETSVSAPYGIRLLIKSMGNHRVMYGSDSPSVTTPDIEINKIRILNLDKETLDNVFYNNISNLIGVNT